MMVFLNSCEVVSRFSFDLHFSKNYCTTNEARIYSGEMTVSSISGAGKT